MDFFLYCCIYTADGCSTKSFTAVIQCQIVYKSVSATVHLIPLELHCATLHPMSTPGAWRPRGFNDGVKHGRLRRLCTNLHQTWCYYVTIAVLKPAAARHRRLDSVVRCAAQFKHRVVDRSWPPRCRIKPKPNMITFTRKKQAPQVMLDCKSHTQGGHTKLSSTTEVAARMPTAFLAPPAKQKHTGPDQLLHLSKLPVAGSSQHLISNKMKLVSQQDITAVPLPPVTVPNKRVTKVITPLTHPEDRSSDSDSSWSTPSSSGASSYQPSSSSAGREEEADDHINARAGQAAAAKQATEFTKELKRCAGKPLAYQAKSTAMQLPAAMPKDTAEMVQGKQQRADEAEGPAAPATKRQRTGKAILNGAEVHMSNAAVKGADTILVEMPADFDIAGDAGSIGRFALQPRKPREAMQMDIKGSMYDTRHVSCSSSLLLVKVANKAGGGGSATVEMATNVYIQASTLQTGPEHADCTKEWSDEENEGFEPAAAPNLKAKITKPKAKRKPRTKVSAKMK